MVCCHRHCFRLVLLHVPIEITLRAVSLAVLPAEPRVMSRTQKLSWVGLLWVTACYSTELLAALFCLSDVRCDVLVVDCAHHVTHLLLQRCSTLFD
jgi:hypothetical protein